jgi:hypothetical protein
MRPFPGPGVTLVMLGPAVGDDQQANQQAKGTGPAGAPGKRSRAPRFVATRPVAILSGLMPESDPWQEWPAWP